MLRTFKRIYYQTDLRYALGLGVIAAIIAMVYVSTWGRTPHFMQNTFGPAVMLATGHGFIYPDVEQLSELESFLNPVMHVSPEQLQDRFDPSNLPEEIPTAKWDLIAAQSMGLLFAAGLVWALLGTVAWSALAPLYGILYGLSAAAIYALFRQIAGRGLSSFATILMILSPVQLNNLVRLRDYGKAPFILLGIVFILWLIRRPCSRGKTLALSLLLGLCVGIGSSFRMDVMILVPPFLVVILFLLPTRWYRIWPARILSLLLFWGAFTLTHPPTPPGLEGAGNVGNYITLGQSPLYDQRLGVHAPTYQTLHRSLDYESLALIQLHHHWQGNPDSLLEFDTAEFSEASKAYISSHVATFPADYVLRGEMAILRTLDELGTNLSNPAPRGVSHPFVLGIYKVHAVCMQVLTRYARYIVPLTLIILSCFSLRQAFAGFFCLSYFLSYSGPIQFASRHYFQYQIFTLLVAVFVLVWLRYGARLAFNRDHWAHWSRFVVPKQLWRRAEWKRALLFIAGTTALLLVPLYGLRFYQAPKVESLLSQYNDAPTRTIQVQARPVEEGQMLLTHPKFSTATFDSLSPTPSFKAQLIMVDVDTTQGPVELAIRYQASKQDLAFDWELPLPQTEQGTTKAVFPVYQARWAGSEDWTCFEGVKVAHDQYDAITGVSRILEPEKLDLPITAVLPADWATLPPWQKQVR